MNFGFTPLRTADSTTFSWLPDWSQRFYCRKMQQRAIDWTTWDQLTPQDCRTRIEFDFKWRSPTLSELRCDAAIFNSTSGGRRPLLGCLLLFPGEREALHLFPASCTFLSVVSAFAVSHSSKTHSLGPSRHVVVLAETEGGVCAVAAAVAFDVIPQPAHSELWAVAHRAAALAGSLPGRLGARVRHRAGS